MCAHCKQTVAMQYIQILNLIGHDQILSPEQVVVYMITRPSFSRLKTRMFVCSLAGQPLHKREEGADLPD